MFDTIPDAALSMQKCHLAHKMKEAALFVSLASATAPFVLPLIISIIVVVSLEHLKSC